MKCDLCHRRLVKIDRREEMADLDDNATDGQMADYIASEMSGDYGAWNIGIVEYYCKRCNKVVQMISDELRSYTPLIIAWHEKASEGDYFSKFVFEYLSFIAHIKNNLYLDQSNDRKVIQCLKKDTVRQESYIKKYWKMIF